MAKHTIEVTTRDGGHVAMCAMGKGHQLVYSGGPDRDSAIRTVISKCHENMAYSPQAHPNGEQKTTAECMDGCSFEVKDLKPAPTEKQADGAVGM